MTITIAISDAQRQTIRQGNDQQRQAIANAAIPDAISPSQYLFFAAFDGTNNDDVVPPPGEQTTNIVQLRNQVTAARAANPSLLVQERYFAGPGAKGTLTNSSWLPPQVTKQVTKAAEKAYQAFIDDAGGWLVNHQGGSVSVALTSFSRGGSSAAIFSQMLYERGLPDPRDTSRYLIPPGRVHVQAGVIFDPVYTGVKGNMAFAPIVSNMVDIFAVNDYRRQFTGVDYRGQQGMTTIAMYGAHADIGGSYDRGIGAVSLQAATDFLRTSGVPIEPITPSRTYNGTVALHSENGWPAYFTFTQDTVLSLDIQGVRRFSNEVVPKYAEDTTLDGAAARKFELFDGRIISVSGECSTTEKVKIDTKFTPDLEKSELTTFRVQPGATSVVEKIKTTSNSRTGIQSIAATVLNSADRLNINVKAARVTTLSIEGANGVDAKVALGNKLALESATGSVEIKGGKFKRVGSGLLSSWEDVGTGIKYTLEGGTPTDGKGELRVTVPGASGGPSSTIVIQDFKNGKLGIKLEDKQGIDSSSKSGSLTEGGATTVTLKADSISDKDRTLKLSASELADRLALVVGDEILSFASGEVEVTLKAGQSEIQFGLLEQGDIDSDQSLQLTSTLLDPDGNVAASDVLALTVKADVELDAPSGTQAPVTTRDIIGDLEPVDTDPTEPGVQGITDDLGNLVTTGNAEPDRADFLVDSAGNDAILPGGGNDTVSASGGGDDFIDAGAGDDTVNAGPGNDLVLGGTGDDQLNGEAGDDRIKGGAGSDVIRGDIFGQAGGNDVLEGGADDDIIYGNAVDDRIYGGDYVSIEDAIAQGNGPAVAGRGEFLEGLDGKDTIVGSATVDVLSGGDGEDVLIGGAGDDVFYGDATYDISGPAWSVTRSVNNNTYTATLNDAVFIGEGTGDDQIRGGAGDDWAFAGGGDDFVTGDAGADVVFGEAGNDTVLGGDGADVISGDSAVSSLAESLHGSDFLDGGLGDDQLYGNGGSDTLFGGEGDDTLIGDGTDILNGGDDYLSGEAGNDELFGGLGSDTVLGGQGDDTLVGDNGGTDASGSADFLDGGVGDDLLTGQGGDDTLIGGDGIDTLQGDDGSDTLGGGEGNDTLLGGAGEDMLAGGEGNDTIVGDNGGTDDSGDADFIDGGAGDDTISGQGGDDMLLGADGEDTIDGGMGDDVLDGGAGNDTQLTGGEGDDSVDGGDGNDLVFGGMGEDTLSGGDGNDTILGDNGGGDLDGGGADFIDGGAGDDQLAGQGGDDMIVGGDGADFLEGDGGNDTLAGSDGIDNVNGGSGDDALEGDAGEDTLFGDTGNDTMSGGDGLDTYHYNFSDGGIDHIDDSGSNTLFLHGISPLALQLGLGSLVLSGGDPANVIHLDNFDPDNVEAGAGIDTFVFDNGTVLSYNDLIARGFTLNGTPDADVLEGTSAEDTINAYESDDVVIAKAGNDTVDLGSGDDIADAGDGNDTVTSGDGNDVVFGGVGEDSLFGDAGDDQLYGEAGADEVEGGEGADLLSGGADEDTLSGGDGDDQLLGDEGADELQGGAGDDLLSGGEGDDTLYGGEGADTLAGGLGDDIYVIDDELDTIAENADEGYDTIEASISYTIADNIEELALSGGEDLTGTGNELDNVLTGNDGNNLLLGLEGDDDLDGGWGDDVLDGGSGADFMAGGMGDDLYIVDDAGDLIGEVQDAYFRHLVYDPFPNIVGYGELAWSGGYDTVEASVSYALGQFTEALVLTGSDAIDGTGNVEANTIEGNEADNALYAYRVNGVIDQYPSGNSVLDQFNVRRSAAEEMLADKGNAAIFRGQFPNEVPQHVDLVAGEGDEIFGGGGDDRLYGGLDNDSLYGGDGNDLLYGFAGADTMEGGAGDDTYVVSDSYQMLFGYNVFGHVGYSDAGENVDELFEAEGEGTDTVISEVDFALPDNIENLTLVVDTRAYDPDEGISGAPERFGRVYATVGQGNDLDNVITANIISSSLYGYGGDDTLIGGDGNDFLDGGEGADFMAGGGSNDTYLVNEAGDVVVEAGGGIDEVQSMIDYTLTAGVENLYLIGETFTENLSGTGNVLDNLIVGNYGDNVLSGLGGKDTLQGGYGADVLTGGAGADTLDGGEGADVMTGNGGDDVYYVDNKLDVTTENADRGHDTVYSSVSHTLGANIEDLYLTEDRNTDGKGNELDNLIIGNDGNNDLKGFDGNDVIEGHEGRDVIDGGKGDDHLSGGRGSDEISGGAGDDELLGGRGDDTLYGNGGKDLLDGGQGDDYMEGGAGGDTYYVDSENDQVVEYFGEGHDLVNSSISFRLADEFEDLTLLGDFEDDIFVEDLWGEGNYQDNIIIGNGGANDLAAFGGDDTIDGAAGNDRVYAGDGDDTIFGGNDALNVTEVAGEDGNPPSYVTMLASNNDWVFGEEGNDAIDGGAGNDELYGDDGDDVLFGGDDGLVASGDSYFEVSAYGGEVTIGLVAVTGDDPEAALEAVFGGNSEENNFRFEEIEVDFALFNANNDYLDGGAGGDILDGGSGDDTLLGGSGEDALYGGEDGPLNTSNRDYLDGGEGIDVMAGGTDDDSYVVDGYYVDTTGTVIDDCGEVVYDAPIRAWTTDTIVEYADEGYDSVYSYADYTLTDNVEQLQLAWYSEARIGRGSSGDNAIYGNEADNRLEGGGGNDALYGNEGDDVLDGGSGDDLLAGGGGDDIYNFGLGYGHDAIDAQGGGFDVVHVLNDLGAADLNFSRHDDDAVIGLAGTQDRLVLANWFGSPSERVQEIQFCDDAALTETDIEALANARIVTAWDDFAEVEEDGGYAATGNVLENDEDSVDGETLTVATAGTFVGAYGTLELSADGSYSYVLNDGAVQFLGYDDYVTDSFTYEVQDSALAFDQATLNIDILGNNDAPVVGSASGQVVEDTTTPGGINLIYNGGFDEFSFAGWNLSGNGSIGFSTPGHSGDAAAFFGYGVTDGVLAQEEIPTQDGQVYDIGFWRTSLAGGNVTVSWNGQVLDSIPDTLWPDYSEFHYQVTGGDGDSELRFDISSNYLLFLDDVTVMSTTPVLPDDQATSGTLVFSDLDLSNVHDVTSDAQDSDYLGQFDAWLAADSEGSGSGSVEWSFSVANDELQFLGEGEVFTQYFNVTVDDGYDNGVGTGVVAVELVGINDAPEADDSVAYLQEDDTLVASDNVLANAFDVDESDVLSIANPGAYAGLYGTLELAADGSYTYTLANDSLAVQSLNEGDTVEEAFVYMVSDGIEDVDATLYVEIDGMNDAPVGLDDAAYVGEDGPLDAIGNVLENDSDIDAGSVLSVSSAGTYLGAYGTLELAEDGSYSYALNATGLQSLAGGEQVQDVFSYDVTDDLVTSSANLTVTVGGENDAPVAEDVAATVSEDGPAVTFTPDYSDVDTGDTHTIAVGAFGNTGFEQGDFAGWTLSDGALGAVVSGGAPFGASYASLSSGAGQDTYTALTRTFALAAGDTLSGLADFVAGDALPYDDDSYVAVRELGGATTLLFNASVTSVGDYGDSGWVPFEFVAPEAGTYVLEAGVRNTQDNSVDSQLRLDGVEQLRPATGVTLNADGTFDYDPGNRYQWLAEGESATDTFTYTVTDNHGARSVATATVEIVGANDAPEIGNADLAATVTEDNAQPAAAAFGADGALAFSDVDLSDAHEVQVGTLDSGYLGEFTAQIAADSTDGGAGSVQWSFSVDNGALDALGEGETREQSYEVLVDDGHGGVDARIVNVTLAGVNDGPVAADDAASAQEDGEPVVYGNVLGNDADVDANDVLQVANPGTYAGMYGSLTLAADGSYSYEVGAVQSLAAGQQVQDVFSYDATDGIAGSTAALTVTVTGANDVPVLLEDIAFVEEDGTQQATGNVLGNDSDVDATDVLQVLSAGTFTGGYGTLTLAADGSYSYALDNAAAQSLAAGQQVREVFSYDATDGIAVSTASLTVTVTGANDVPVTQDDSAIVQEDGTLVANGNLLANDDDVDGGTTLTVENAGVYGSLSVSANGDYAYTLDNASAAVQGLRAGEVVTDSFEYFASDGIASTAGYLVVTVNGTNDNPVARNDAGAAQEDGPAVTLLAISLLANDTDADAGDTKAITTVTNSMAGAQVTLVAGNAVYNVGGLFQTLKAGATTADTFSYTMVDGAGAASTTTVTMTITGVNDAPVLVNPIPDQNAAAGTAFNFVFAAITFNDIDVGDALSYSATQADGTALPSWLTFNAATRAFSGTPPGGTGGTGGTGGDCGCGTGGGTVTDAVQIRLVATDTAGASASDQFVLNISGVSGGSGIVPIVGTDHDDVIAGTSGNDVIDGREGYDKMTGGAGDDVYYVDKTGSKVDLVTEGATSGYDTVYSSANYTLGSNIEELHLIGDDDLVGHGNALANMVIGNAGDNRLYGEAGNDLLLDDAGDDLLDGGAGDDVLDGGVGNDSLIGGAGNDLFVHAAGGGDDIVQDSGGTDAIRFGAGITATDLTVRCADNDLVLRLSGGNGSVTVKDWFSSSSKRVEQVQFADGTTWNEAAIRARVTSGSSGGSGSHDDHGGYGGGGSGGHDDHGGYGDGDSHSSDCGSSGHDDHDGHHGGSGHGDHDRDGDDCGTDETRDAIAQRLKHNPNYDFTALAQYLQRNGGGAYGAMTPQQIAQRWLQVQNCVGSLAQADDDCGGGYGGHGGHGGGYGRDDDGHGNGGWGHSGSTGQSRGCGGMDTFSGLGEGFRRL